MTRPDRPAATLVLAVVLTVLGVGQRLSGSEPAGDLVAVLAGSLALAAAPARPALPAALVACSVAAQSLLGDPQPAFATFLSMLVATYLLGRQCGWRRSALGLGALAVGLAVMIGQDPTLQRPAEVLIPAVYLSGALAVGRVAAGRQRAAQAAVVAERVAAEQRERAALLEQRAEIARDMHDVVAHSLSLVVVQAEAALAVLPSDPARSQALVEDVATTGRQALVEMRRALGVVRGPAARGPQPGLGDLEALVEPLRRSGTTVHLDVDPEARGLVDPGLELAVYRVVQEALTNAVRHGRAGDVRVAVQRSRDELTVCVQDDGTPGVAAGGSGTGLVGMRERVRAYGGSVEAGRAADRGWRVRATLPLAPVP